MKFDPGKVWPHPVLRPPRYGDDYTQAEFEVEIEVDRAEGGLTVRVEADFQLSDPDLLRLVEKEFAQYVLLVRSPQTHYREPESVGKDSHIKVIYPQGELSGKVEFCPFLIAIERIDHFVAAGWHDDFKGLSFDIDVGSVLAEDMPKEYWIDTADESPIGTIFEHISIPDSQDGMWRLRLDAERVGIEMSEGDSNMYSNAREKANETAEGQYLMNGLYLPVLISVLTAADIDSKMYEEYRWFASLNKRLEDVECSLLGSENADRSVDAQKVLDYPFTKMPLIALEVVDK